MIKLIRNAIVYLLFSSVLLTGCTDAKHMIFTGKSNHWKADYQVTVTDKYSETSTLTIHYVGEKPIPKKAKYSVEDATGGTKGESSLTNGILQAGGHSCKGCAVVDKNEKMKTTITWNGKSESLILKRK